MSLLLDLLEDNSKENGTYKVRLHCYVRGYGSYVDRMHVEDGLIMDIPSVPVDKRAKYLSVLSSDAVFDTVEHAVYESTLSKANVENSKKQIWNACKEVSADVDALFKSSYQSSVKTMKESIVELSKAEQYEKELVDLKHEQDTKMFGIPKFFSSLKSKYFSASDSMDDFSSLESRIESAHQSVKSCQKRYEFFRSNQLSELFIQFDKQFMDMDNARAAYENSEKQNSVKEKGLVMAVSLENKQNLAASILNTCAVSFEADPRCFYDGGKFAGVPTRDLQMFIKNFGKENQPDEDSLNLYVKNGFVLPESMDNIRFYVATSSSTDHKTVTLTPVRKVSGLYKMDYLRVEDGYDMDHPYANDLTSTYVFLDGKKMAKAVGCAYTVEQSDNTLQLERDGKLFVLDFEKDKSKSVQNVR